LYAQSEVKKVSEEVMQKVYNEVKTPYKYGLIIVPEDNSKKTDCPSVFRKGNMWYMTYIMFDGRGYETYLAKSKDLLQWTKMGKIMSFNSDTTKWDCHHKAGYIALQEYTWGGSYEWQKYDGKYWMSYFGGNTRGYEAGLLSIGIANSKKDPTVVHEWDYLTSPVLMSTDKDVRWWENRKLYKSSVIWDKKKTLGYEFVMYYNANGDSAKIENKKTRWYERIGMAVSNDMLHWQRYIQEPVMHHPLGITADAVIQKIDDVWVMFYYGAYWQGRKDAFNRFACSYDMVIWTDWQGDDLIKASESYDDLYAHKSFVVKWNGVVYHFYNAVNKKQQRGIAVATSKDLGKSVLSFVSDTK
jgi:predicted GH43/DUF377 family glycosyl hydrolase